MPFMSLSQAKAKKGEGDNKNEEFHTGGGQAVLRPKKTEDDPMTALASQARSQAGSTEAQDANIGRITIYSNGFILGSGAFRDKNIPENAAFLKELMKGYVPAELEQEARREWGDIDQVRVQLVDKSKETYTPPKPAFSFNDSQGQTLGGQSKVSLASFETAIPVEYKTPPGEKETNLQIITHDRKKLTAKFAHTATVFQVYQHVMFVSSQGNFVLLSGYPPKPLTDPNVTLEEAKLLGTSISQRLQDNSDSAEGPGKVEAGDSEAAAAPAGNSAAAPRNSAAADNSGSAGCSCQ
eukprot:g31486.t1